MEKERRKLKVTNIHVHDDPEERQAALQKIAENIAWSLYLMREQEKNKSEGT